MDDPEFYIIRDDRTGELKAVGRKEYEEWKERRRIRRSN